MAQTLPIQHRDLSKEFEEDIPGASSGRGAVIWIVLGLLFMTGVFVLILVAIPHIAG